MFSIFISIDAYCISFLNGRFLRGRRWSASADFISQIKQGGHLFNEKFPGLRHLTDLFVRCWGKWPPKQWFLEDILVWFYQS